MLKIIVKVFFLLMFSSLFSCSDSNTESEQDVLVNKLWILESFETNGLVDIPPQDQIYNIQFSESNTFSGKNDCNTISGTYSWEANSLVITNISTTKIYCGKDSMDFRFLDALQSTTSYSVSGNRLTIFYGSNSILNFIGS